MTQLRQTIRRLFRSPGFTLTTVLTLSVGIGATIAIFSVVNGVLLKPLPFPNSDRLIALVHQAPGIGDTDRSPRPRPSISLTASTARRSSLSRFGSRTLPASRARAIRKKCRGSWARTSCCRLSACSRLLGRTFNEADDQRGAAPTVILSYGYWQRRFGGAENVLGQVLVGRRHAARNHRCVAPGLPVHAAAGRHRDSWRVRISGVPFVPSIGGARHREAQGWRDARAGLRRRGAHDPDLPRQPPDRAGAHEGSRRRHAARPQPALAEGRHRRRFG